MLDTLQIVLLVIIVLISILLVVLGVQVYMILKEVRKTVQKANTVLDHAGSITESVSAPISALSTMATSLKAGSLVAGIKIVRSLLAKDKEEK